MYGIMQHRWKVVLFCFTVSVHYSGNKYWTNQSFLRLHITHFTSISCYSFIFPRQKLPEFPSFIRHFKETSQIKMYGKYGLAFNNSIVNSAFSYDSQSSHQRIAALSFLKAAFI